MINTQDILFGHDPTPGIVAVEPGPRGVRVYRRVDDAVVTEDCEFRQWMLTTHKQPLEGAQWTELEGEGFRYLAEFEDRSSYNNARTFLRDQHAQVISLPSASKQYLVRSGRTLFKGMAFEDVLRMQLDIETLGLRPDDPENEIFLVSLSDNRGYEAQITGDEASILREMVRLVRERDPDVIEGHNILGFDFPYIASRAKRYGIRLGLGRDGSEISFGSTQNCAIGYFSRPFAPVHIHGRHVIDTLLAVQRYDVARGELSSHSLKAVAVAYDIAEEDREIIPHAEIADEWKANPERVKKYALQDVLETRSLAELICPPEFYLTQMVPETYSRAVTTGTGEKINTLFIREYLRQGKAIPLQRDPSPLPGGYTEVRTIGVIAPVVKCDVESLYPSIMLTQCIRPETDTLNVFLPMLEELTKRRFEGKRRAKEGQGRERAYWDGVQSAFKILINSFYGYLAGPFNFNDYHAAARVTTTGQSIVKKIVEELEKSGSVVIEIDTDGVYFKPPAGVDTEEKEVEYINNIGSTLPEGIRLAHDGRYRAMISLKMKNYVLASYSGKMVFKGSALRSRADERFGIDFISRAAEYLLDNRKDQVRELYQSLCKTIDSGAMPVADFARRERVTEKTFTSTGKKRLAQAARGVKVGEYISIYERADGSIGLVSEYNNDEDRSYLRDKLYKFACRLREAFGDDFDQVFPKPGIQSKREAEGQQTLGLFD